MLCIVVVPRYHILKRIKTGTVATANPTQSGQLEPRLIINVLAQPSER
jgi:hypothetical protein